MYVTGLGFNGEYSGLNPLTGEPLRPGQALITGPAWTGPRQTVVWVGQPTTWPRWITNVNGTPVDDGTITGGTWAGGSQQLPELRATAVSPLWVLVLVLFIVSALLGRPERTD